MSELKFKENRCAVNPPRVMKTWEPCIICLDDAATVARDSLVSDGWGAPIAASCWTSEEGYLRMFCADFPNGRRLIRRYSSRGWKITFTATPKGTPK